MKEINAENAILKLQKSENLNDLSKLLDIDLIDLLNALSIPVRLRYRSIKIPKKNGEFREISIPHEDLKPIQRKLSKFLNCCISEIEASNKKLYFGFSHGYTNYKSIQTNAWKHKKKSYVLNIDLKNYFPSITFFRVREFFIKNYKFKLNPYIADAIANISCHKNQLPQGSPCSPIISNMIARNLDNFLSKHAKKYNCSYTRYVDDITFSTGSNYFPIEIAVKSETDNSILISDSVKKIIHDSYFEINYEKISLMQSNSRQIITGLIVSREKINVRKRYYRLARAMVYNLLTQGNFYFKTNLKPHDIDDSVESKIICPPVDSDANEAIIRMNKLEGVLRHIYLTRNFKHQIPKVKMNIRKNLQSNTYVNNFVTDKSKINNCCDYPGMPSEHKLLWSFLFFKNFINLDKPLVICEGKTDTIYLKCAIIRLYDLYPNIYNILAEKDLHKIKLMISFFKYPSDKKHKNIPDTFTNDLSLNLLKPDRILGLRGGAASKIKFIESYEFLFKKFKISKPKFPVIILIDIDKNASNCSSKKVFKKCKECSIDQKQFTNPNNEFYHVNNNLYLIKIPENKHPDRPNTDISEIEELFDNETRNMIDISGHNLNGTSDSGICLDKKAFAINIIAYNYLKIDFSGFELLLDRFSSAILHYRKILN